MLNETTIKPTLCLQDDAMFVWKHWTPASGEQTADVSAWVWRLVHELKGGFAAFPIMLNE